MKSKLLAAVTVPSFLATTLFFSAAGTALSLQVEHNVPQVTQQAIDQGSVDPQSE